MKSLTTGLTLCLLALLLNLSAGGQDNKAAGDDSAAVLATVRVYVEAYFSGDAQRMQHTLHPHYMKHLIHGNVPAGNTTDTEMVEEIRSEGTTDLPEEEQTKQITLLDISGDIASVKLVTLRSVAYVTLLKTGGEWKILSAVQRLDN